VRRLIFTRLLKDALLTGWIVLAFATVAAAVITGSKHDLSGKGWGTDEICKFCHIPHNAISVIDGAWKAPLWNHKMTTANFTMYSSPSLKVNPDPQPRSPSKLCLSCHDGVTAIDSYGTRSGTHLMTGSSNLGTDLSDDHPISIPWDHRAATGGNCLGCHVMHGGGELKPDLPLRNGYIECVSCHEPHNKYSFPNMTRYTMAGSALCLKCHGK